MKNLRNNRTAAVAVGAALLVGVGATGTAVADNMIGTRDIKNGAVHSSDIKDNDIRSRDIHDGTIKGKDIKKHVVGYSRLGRGVVSKLDSLGAIEEAKTGPKGEKGDKGDKGDPGQSLVANEVTPAHTGGPAPVDGLHVAEVDSSAVNGNAPTATEGTDLLGAPIKLAAGQYLVHATVQFFDFDGDTGDVDYGVARLFLDGTEVPTSAIWTPAIPGDGNNAAQASGTLVVTVPAGGGSLMPRAAIRGDDSGQAGATVIVTKIG